MIPVSVDLSTLVREIYVAPDSPRWIAQVIGDVTSRYGYDFAVRQSDLATDPIE